MDAHFENQVIDELVAQGYSEDQVLDAIVELEDEDGTLYASGKKAERKAARQEKKEAKKAAKAEKKEEKKAAKAEKKEAKKAAKTHQQELKAAAKEAKKETKAANKAAKVATRQAKAAAKASAIANGTYNPTSTKPRAVKKVEVDDEEAEVATKVAEIAATTAESNGLTGEAADEVVNKALEDAGIETEETVDTVVEEKKSKLPLILGIGGGVLAIIIIVVIILARRKK